MHSPHFRCPCAERLGWQLYEDRTIETRTNLLGRQERWQEQPNSFETRKSASPNRSDKPPTRGRSVVFVQHTEEETETFAWKADVRILCVDDDSDPTSY
jgi:hypothetical protein